MRVTIQKTINLDEVPSEISDNYRNAVHRLQSVRIKINRANQLADNGRYIDSSNQIEEIRELLGLLDKSMEEQQSLCLSYEQIRIAEQMPESEDE